MKVVVIKVADVIRRPYGVLSDEGDKVCNSIYPLLLKGKKVEVSFQGMEITISSFLCHSIAILYKKLSKEQLSNLTVTGLDADNMSILQRLIDKAESGNIYF